MSAITVLAAGPKAKSGTSTPLDVSAHAALRLDLTLLADLGTRPQLDLWIETGPAATGPWTELTHFRQLAGDPGYSPHAWQTQRRLPLSSIDTFVRARWVGQANANSGDGDPQLVLGITGDGKPDAE